MWTELKAASLPSKEESPRTPRTENQRPTRAVLNHLAYIHLEPDSGAIVLNVSEEGLGFHAVAPVHQTGTLRFSVSVKGYGRMQATGDLVWTDESRKAGGIRFTYLPQAARAEMMRWAAQSGVPLVNRNADAVPDPGPASSREAFRPSPEISSWQSSGKLPGEAVTSAATAVQAEQSAAQSPSESASQAVDDHYEGSLFGTIVRPTDARAENETDEPRRPFKPYEHSYDEGLLNQLEKAERRPRFLGGFLTGVIACILCAGGYFVYLRTHTAEGPRQAAAVTADASSPGEVPSAAQSDANSKAPLPPATPKQTETAATPAPSTSSKGSAPAAVENRPSARASLPVTPPVAPAPPLKRVYAGSGSKGEDSADVYEDGESALKAAQDFLYGTNGPRNSAAAANLLWAAISKGNEAAELILADLYARGDGVAKNCAQAQVLLRAAADKGSSDAVQELQQLRSRGCAD